MLKYFSADWIFPVNSLPIRNGVVGVNLDGKIEKILTEDIAKQPDLVIEKFRGAIVPGFINTHCHLELSHMLGQIPKHTGLVNFVQSIITNRQSDAKTVILAMQNANQQLYDNGIVVVGDISNQVISKQIKETSKIYYHTFVEAMSFNPERAKAVMDYAISIKNEFLPLPATVVPHAPYSVSAELFELIYQAANKENAFLSVHNQETGDENAFFENKGGRFLELYNFLGLDISFFQPSGKTSFQTWLPYIKGQKTLLVHNTVTSQEDVAFAKKNHSDLYWCLCPQANLYIENSLPNVELFINEDIKITLGTDSLASNHQLNILSEMKTLQEHKQIDFKKLLQWATINGAEFLELDKQFGTIEIGKKPGLNLIQLSEDFIIQSDKVIKLI